MTIRLFFQNPRDGHPMRLSIRSVRPVVEACECDDTRSCAELDCRAIMDAQDMSAAVSACPTVYDAACILHDLHGCEDLLLTRVGFHGGA